MNDNDNHLQMGGEDVAFATSSPPKQGNRIKIWDAWSSKDFRVSVQMNGNRETSYAVSFSKIKCDCPAPPNCFDARASTPKREKTIRFYANNNQIVLNRFIT